MADTETLPQSPFPDRWVVALAASTAIGVRVAAVRPAVAVVALGTPLLLIRRRVLWLLLGLLIGSVFGARAWASLPNVEAGALRSAAVLVSDPIRRGNTTNVVIEVDGRRLDAWASGSAARRLARRSAGEVVAVEGSVRPLRTGRQRYLVVRHIVGSARIDRVLAWSEGNALTRSTTRVRRLLADGARSLGPVNQSLYLGLVIGDDRAQPRTLVDDFRSAGLGHLCAVSGQNVVLTLAVATVLLRRLRALWRWWFTIALLAWFATLTRFEPSVLRATLMAGLAATTFALGRRASPIRLLSLAVIAALLIDPLLVHSVGFWMSVSATAGIVLGSARVARGIPGPRWLAVALAVTLSAQVAISPIVWTVFGRDAAWALPANLLAEPAALVVMTYGLPAGLLAGVLPGALTTWVHAPTWVALTWLRSVARVAALADWPPIRPVSTLATASLFCWLWWRSRSHGAPAEPATRGPAK